jgi:glycosyltransferase involved in cell wall biosynthesis
MTPQARDRRSGATPAARFASADEHSGRSRTASVVVAHPGGQHELETVLAAQDDGLLKAFATGFYFGADSPWSNLARRVHSLPLGSRLLKSAPNRLHPALDSRRVVSFPAHVVAAKLARHLGSAQRPGEWASARWDAAVARWLRCLEEPPALIHAFEGGAEAILGTARECGLVGVLDVPSAHEYVRRELEREGVRTTDRITSRVHAERALTHRILAPSDFVVRCLVEHGVEQKKILRLPYGANVRDDLADAERRERVFRTLFVGAVGPGKGVRYLLDAWRAVALPDAELLLVGGAGPYGRQLLRRSGGKVRWLGQVSRTEAVAWFTRSDVFVLPSLAEGSALVTYEAMAAGLPVITTPNSGSIVRDGIDGFIVPPRDVEALAERLLLLYRASDVRREMGANGRALVAEGYTWGHYRRRLCAVYEALLAGSDPTLFLADEFARETGQLQLQVNARREVDARRA